MVTVSSSYLPIEDHGIIGNMRTAALVGKNGSIDWFCFPRFDSPSVFGSILDAERGGHFTVTHRLGEGGAVLKQFYWPDTNVLVTRFLAEDGVAELCDFMPVVLGPSGRGFNWIVRRLTVVHGTLPFRMECRPAFDYGRKTHKMELTPEGACFRTDDLTLSLTATHPLKRNGKGVVSDFTLGEGETAVFVVGRADPDGRCISCPTREEAFELFQATIQFWRSWLGQCTYQGRWREMVYRSALVLKLLTYEPTGAMVAAPTCSLPEAIAGERNWDYRYTWMRDAGFTLYAFMRIGFTEEAARFMQWLEERCHEVEHGGALQIMYGIDGKHELREEALDHLEGYRSSRPVRIGNGAFDQVQLDIYGELLDAVYLYNKYRTPISYDLWTNLCPLVEWVCDHWREKDQGIWEVRGAAQDFVYSKLMCWVALDRALRLADKRSFPANRDRWLKERDAIYTEVMARGWSRDRLAFVQAYGSDALDAANLLMPLVFFVSPTDPRMLRTLDALQRSPESGGLQQGGLVYRYDVKKDIDGLAGAEGTFNICTFWLVEALTRAGQVEHSRLEEARLLFENMLGYANHLGLYAEETGPRGEALGNFPQALTHLSLISAAFNLDRVLGRHD